MVRRDDLLADPLGEVQCQALGQAAGVYEDEGRPVLRDQLGEPVVDLLPDLAGRDRLDR